LLNEKLAEHEADVDSSFPEETRQNLIAHDLADDIDDWKNFAHEYPLDDAEKEKLTCS
jgi:cell wall assembly regulator SMI1